VAPIGYGYIGGYRSARVRVRIGGYYGNYGYNYGNHYYNSLNNYYAYGPGGGMAHLPSGWVVMATGLLSTIAAVLFYRSA